MAVPLIHHPSSPQVTSHDGRAGAWISARRLSTALAAVAVIASAMTLVPACCGDCQQ